EWLAYAITRVDGDGEVRLRETAGDSTHVLELGRNPAFSKDGRWLAYTIGVAEKEREALEKANKPVRSKLALIELDNNERLVIDDIPSFSFSGDGRYLAMSGYAPEGRKSKGVDVIVRDLRAGTQVSFGNVASFAWQDEGSLIVLALDAEGKLGNGVQLYDPSTGTLRTLDSDTATYAGLEWRDESADLAVLKVRPDDDYEEPNHVVLAWSGLGGGEPVTRVLDPATMSGFPEDMRIVDHRELEWSEDGATLFFGIQAWEPKDPAEEDTTQVAEADTADAETEEPEPTPDDDETDADEDDTDDEKPGVEIWHARDVDIIPEQKVRAEMDRKRNLLVAWHLADDRIVEIGADLADAVTLVEGVPLAFATDRAPYEREGMFGPRYHDLYVVDTDTGERTKVKERVQVEYGLSPAGKYVLYLESDHYWVYDVARATHTNITRDVPTLFVNLEDDHTVAQKPPFGIGGWTPDDRSVLLYDKHDVWEVAPDGSSAERLSDGAADSVRHRVVRLDIEEDVVDPSDPVYVALYGERSKKYGYGTIERGEQPRRLVFLDKNVTRLTKADDADVFVYQVRGFDDSPDYFAGGADLDEATQVSETNPFQSDYAWGRSELIDFENTHGQPLQGALFYPANYEPGRKYPMIVYIYERTSQTVHNYTAPSEQSAYNPTVWTQNGYFVFRPDIVYRDRNPGLSAVEALVPAVEAAVATGMIDETKVGLIGHSWGGYQTAFVPTQTDIFAAAVAGAPLTELYTMYLSIYWNTGGTDARIFEISQGRMEVPPWQDLEAYLANSPV
ncbi:MAG: prolyl oligopeptidase family serine peptidase, partial [Longimicrobiales bacterium]